MAHGFTDGTDETLITTRNEEEMASEKGLFYCNGPVGEACGRDTRFCSFSNKLFACYSLKDRERTELVG